jgi:hypothetical protein
VWGHFLHFSLLEVVCTPPPSEKNVRVLEGQNIDNVQMLKAYKVAFPGFKRDGDILKKCWNNWKDSAAYKEFTRTIRFKK